LHALCRILDRLNIACSFLAVRLCLSLVPTMQQELDQVVQATLIASNPSQGSLHRQALDYLTTIQHNSENTWGLVLSIYVDVSPEGARKYPPQARFFALRVLDDFFDNR
jgi:exportin-T